MTIEYYNKNAEKFFNDTHKLDMSEIYNEFIKHLPNKGKILKHLKVKHPNNI